MKKKSIKIGNASGFWGDDPFALKNQLEGGETDYITADYLAELSMSILHKQQKLQSHLGYIPDFVEHLSYCLDSFSGKKTKIITNAGGNNPKACAEKVMELFKNKGLKVKVAYVEGDNLMPHISQLTNTNRFDNLEENTPFQTISNQLKSANAYVGMLSIIEALKLDPDIIITGRATDSSISMAPIIHELGWGLEDYDKLALAMIGAHILECGTQATGGNFTDWKKVKQWDKIGFPIIEVFENDTLEVYKHPGTGGIVTKETVTEQLIYEIENPKYYYSPDVIADITGIEITQKEEDRVIIKGAKGLPPTPFYKVSMAYHKGYRTAGTVLISAPDVLEKAKVFETIIQERFGKNIQKQHTELIGFDSMHLKLKEYDTCNEILLKSHVFDTNKNKIDLFRKQFTSLVLSGPPGITAYGGRSKIQEVIAYWPTLVKKEEVSLYATCLNENGETKKLNNIIDTRGATPKISNPKPLNIQQTSQSYKNKKLIDCCFARSGDKGNAVNIGVVARSEEDYRFLYHYLTSERVKDWFSNHCFGQVVRYDIPNIKGFNFFLKNSLDGGGTVSMRSDNQGKSFAQALLNQKIIK